MPFTYFGYATTHHPACSRFNDCKVPAVLRTNPLITSEASRRNGGTLNLLSQHPCLLNPPGKFTNQTNLRDRIRQRFVRLAYHGGPSPRQTRPLFIIGHDAEIRCLRGIQQLPRPFVHLPLRVLSIFKQKSSSVARCLRGYMMRHPWIASANSAPHASKRCRRIARLGRDQFGLRRTRLAAGSANDVPKSGATRGAVSPSSRRTHGMVCRPTSLSSSSCFSCLEYRALLLDLAREALHPGDIVSCDLPIRREMLRGLPCREQLILRRGVPVEGGDREHSEPVLGKGDMHAVRAEP